MIESMLGMMKKVASKENVLSISMLRLTLEVIACFLARPVIVNGVVTCLMLFGAIARARRSSTTLIPAPVSTVRATSSLFTIANKMGHLFASVTSAEREERRRRVRWLGDLLVLVEVEMGG